MNLTRLLEGSFQVKASDIHLKWDQAPVLRVNSKLTPVKHPVLTDEDLEQAVREILPPRLQDTFDTEGAADFAHNMPGLGRFRVAAFHQRGHISITCRRITPQPPELEELSLPKVIEKLTRLNRGLVLVTGITGSGKSSTLAALLHRINRTRRAHIVTIEDPIEYLFQDDQCIINQMEIGLDCPSFNVAMRRILRFDPDIIMIGEMRDRETVATAIEAVDTGHLVFSTLHTSDAKQTINRVLHFFEKREEQMILELLAHNLKAVISQRLMARSDKPGLLPACELLLNTPIAGKLIKEGRIEEIEQVLKNGEDGMQTFDMSLADLVREGKITIESAMQHATDEASVRRMIRGEFSAGDKSGLIR